MKNKILVILCITLCVGLTACGKAENDAAKGTDAVTEIVAETEGEKTTEAAVETPSTEAKAENAVEQETDEVFGDVDIAADGLTMKDMQELVLNLDIPITEYKENSIADFNGGEFKILFPSGQYITEQSTGMSRAKLESIDFNINLDTREIEAPTSVREERGEALETIGKYVLETAQVRNASIGFQKTYHIYNTETKSALFLTLTINKVSEYQAYGDSLVEEFVPAFEKTLRSNIEQ